MVSASWLTGNLFGDTTCSAAVANAALRCLKFPFHLGAFGSDFSAGVVCGTVLGLCLSVAVHHLRGANTREASFPAAPVNVRVSQRIDHGRPSRPQESASHSSSTTSTAATASERDLRVRPLRGGAGTLA